MKIQYEGVLNVSLKDGKKLSGPFNGVIFEDGLDIIVVRHIKKADCERADLLLEDGTVIDALTASVEELNKFRSK